MPKNNTTHNNSKQGAPVGTKTSFFYYLMVFAVVLIFGIIVQNNVELPQSILRPLGVIVVTLIFGSAFFKPTVPFLVLVAYMPFSKILVGDFATEATGFNLTNVFIFIAIVGWVVNAAGHQERFFSKSTLTLPIMLFIFWGFVSLIRCTFAYGSTYFDNFIIPVKRWLTPILLYFIAVNAVRDRATFKKAVIVMMIVILIIAMMASFDYFSEKQYASDLDKARVGGVFEQPNTLGGFFVYTMFLFLGFFFVYFPNLKYVMMLIPFLICFRGLMVTFSRGAYIGCAAGAVATTFFKSRLLFLVCIFLLVFAVLNPVLLPAGIRSRMGSTFGGGDRVISMDVEDITDKSASRRILIWQGAIAMIKDYPVFGVGYGLFPHIIPSYAAVKEVDAHNTYLILAAEMGIPALIIFLLILLILIKNSWWLYIKTQDKFVKASALGILGGLFGLLMVNMFGSRLNSEEVGAYFWIYAGLIMAAVRIKQEKKIS